MNDSGDLPSDPVPARSEDVAEQAAAAPQDLSNQRSEPSQPSGQANSNPPAAEAAATGSDESPSSEDTGEPASAAGESSDPSAGADPPSAEPAPSPPKAANGNGGGNGNGSGNGSQKASNGRSGRSGSKRVAPRRSPVNAIPWGEPLALVRYGKMSQVGVFRHNVEPAPGRNTEVVIRTERGVELGVVLTSLAREAPAAETPPDPPAEPAGCGKSCMLGCERLKALGADGRSQYGFNRQNKILRLASVQDVNDQIHLDRNEREKKQYCHQQAAELGLTMRLVTVEHLLGGERVIFYFTSESRVDFRELVRRLAGQYRTRIEMRQIGARDEARLIGDYERCGQRCCCQVFLGTLQPVSIRMAKVQKATLDPSKISGRCNRLMCCLRFEDDTYEALRKKLPKKNIWVRTAELVGKVISSQILTQLVRVVDVQGALSVIDVDSILERNVDPPDPQEAAARTRRSSGESARSRSRRSEPAPEAAPAAAAGDPSARANADDPSTDSGQKPRRRRRRRGKGTKTDSAAPANAPANAAAAPANPAGGDAPRKKRRRRRRRPKGGDGNGGGNGGGA